MQRGMFARSDRVRLLALPLYLLALVFRHEAGHAVCAVIHDGATVTEFSILPRHAPLFNDEGTAVDCRTCTSQNSCPDRLPKPG